MKKYFYKFLSCLFLSGKKKYLSVFYRALFFNPSDVIDPTSYLMLSI